MSKLKDQLKVIMPSLAVEANQCRDEAIKSKYKQLKFIVESKRSVTQACAWVGRSTDWFAKWAHRLIEGQSLSALADLSREPKYSPKKTLKRIEKRVVQIRKTQPFLGPERIGDDLKRLFNMHCPPSTVYNILKRNNLITVETKKRTTKKHIKRYRRALPGFCQLDVKYVPQLIGEQRYYMFNFVDHCTTWRFIRVYPSLSHEYVAQFLAALQTECPFPIVEIQTDNGVEFTDKYRGGRLTPSGLHVLDLWCKDQGVRHRLIPIGQKELNGKVENTHKQDDREFFSQNVFTAYSDLRVSVASYNERWNLQRRTKALGWRTPDQALEFACVRVLAWRAVCIEKYGGNPNHLVFRDGDFNTYIEAPEPKPRKAKTNRRKESSVLYRYLQYDEWSRKKSS